MINLIKEVFTEQTSGIIAGVLITLISLGILFFIKKIWYYIKRVPNYFFKKKIERDITQKIKKSNKEIGLSMLPKIKLKIVKKDLDPEMLNDKVIIYTKKTKKSQVYSNIISQALEVDYLQDSRRHLSKDLYNSSKYILGKSLITGDISHNNLNNFRKETLRYYERKMENIINDDKCRTLAKKQDKLIKKRLFKTVLLQEMFALGERLLGNLPNTDSKKESKELVEFLYNIANKEEYQKNVGKEPILSFIRKYFKLSIILVKRGCKKSLNPHFQALKKDIKNGSLSIYIMGWGHHVNDIKHNFLTRLKKISTSSEYKQWKIKKMIKYSLPKDSENNKEVPGICCLFKHENWLK